MRLPPPDTTSHSVDTTPQQSTPRRIVNATKRGARMLGSIYWNDFKDGLKELGTVAKNLPLPGDTRADFERKLPTLAKAGASVAVNAALPGGPVVKAVLFPLVRHGIGKLRQP